MANIPKERYSLGVWFLLQSVHHPQRCTKCAGRSGCLFSRQTTASSLPRAVIQHHLPTPLSSTPGLFTQRRACSILPSKVTAGLAGLMLATARLVLDCRVSSAAPICLASARASGLSPLPLRQKQRQLERETKKHKRLNIDYKITLHPC